MNLPPLRDIHDPKTPSPTASDERGRSSPTSLVDVVARKGFEDGHASACGRDIYAISAPIVVEAAQRIVTGLANKSGVVAPGEVVDAPQFLESLFFFSSRRRHTRLTCDWSSDVCSSDLVRAVRRTEGRVDRPRRERGMVDRAQLLELVVEEDRVVDHELARVRWCLVEQVVLGDRRSVV